MYHRLRTYLTDSDDDTPDLPDTVEFYDLEAAYEVWTLERATDWKWPLDVLLRQPQTLLDDVLYLEALAIKIKKSLKDNK